MVYTASVIKCCEIDCPLFNEESNYVIIDTNAECSPLLF